MSSPPPFSVTTQQLMQRAQSVLGSSTRVRMERSHRTMHASSPYGASERSSEAVLARASAVLERYVSSTPFFFCIAARPMLLASACRDFCVCVRVCVRKDHARARTDGWRGDVTYTHSHKRKHALRAASARATMQMAVACRSRFIESDRSRPVHGRVCCRRRLRSWSAPSAPWPSLRVLVHARRRSAAP